MKSQILNLVLVTILLGLGFYLGRASNNKSNATTSDSTLILEEDTKINEEPANPSPRNSIKPAPRKENKGLTKNERTTINLFEEAAPSVVFITTSALVQRGYFSRDLAEIPRGTGTGFMWGGEGHIVTNYHVVQNGDRFQVTLNDQSTWDAKLIGAAPKKDLAVLKIDAPRNLIHPIPLGDSESLQVGQGTYAIGNPFGLDQSLTTGIISALGREIESVGGVTIQDVIQTDAAINPGNSGGPLLNSSGELIGVNTAIYSPSGAYAGIGFSIPVDAVTWVIPDLIKYGRINRATIGVSQLRIQQPIEGVIIHQVFEGTGAERAGLRPTLRDRYGKAALGDIIIGVNGKKITSYSDLVLALEEYKPGDMVKLTIIRDREEAAVEVELGSSVE